MSFFKPKTYKTRSELVRGCLNGERRAQVALYDRSKAKLLGICLRYAHTVAEAEDIFQEAILKIFNRISDLEKPELLDPWMRSVVIRTAINYYNRTTRQELRNTGLDEASYELENDDYLRIIDQTNVEALLEIINALPQKYRLIINLYLIDGYQHAEIAKMLSMSENTSRSQYMRARNLLMLKLQESGITANEH
ncbi:sigma-70 family RNA polymerase sigma factor [Ravibacter arvi]|uniref:Sigma-70 family RNA polymerase sigma factor n=1 Tax=Ravibacter arvi TaxID=2051041 RepID=A0ABP8MCF8_9BACT